MTTPRSYKWEHRFIVLAEHVAGWSKDGTGVGAVIVNRDLRVVVGMGYNGFPRGVKDTPERLEDREQKYFHVVHAEVNAVLNANAPVRGCVMYGNQIPCPDCSKVIIQSGIVQVVARKNTEQRWTESLPMLEEAGVEVLLYDVHRDWLGRPA